jgi:hypothetical protein
MQFVFHCITADLTGTAKTGADEKEAKLDAVFTLSSSRFSLRQFAAENLKCPAQPARRGGRKSFGVWTQLRFDTQNFFPSWTLFRIAP